MYPLRQLLQLKPYTVNPQIKQPVPSIRPKVMNPHQNGTPAVKITRRKETIRDAKKGSWPPENASSERGEDGESGYVQLSSWWLGLVVGYHPQQELGFNPPNHVWYVHLTPGLVWCLRGPRNCGSKLQKGVNGNHGVMNA